MADITPLERLILDLVFDAEIEGDDIAYYSWCGPSGVFTLSIGDLRAACEASRGQGESGLGKRVATLLDRYDANADGDAPDDIDVDLTGADSGWDHMFQDIVRRSATVDEIVVTTAFTCTKMRPDGFGGSVMLVTADAIRYRSTTEILEEFWNEAAKTAAVRKLPSSADNP